MKVCQYMWLYLNIQQWLIHTCTCTTIMLVHVVHTGAVLEILLSSFQAACSSWMRTVGSSRRVSSDAAAQIFAKVSNFPSWRPKKKGLHCISLTKSWNKGQLTLLFSPLCTLWPKRGTPIVEGKSWVVSGNLRNPSKTTPEYIYVASY